MNRTIQVQLHPTPEQAAVLQQTMQQFTSAYNAVIAYGWHNREKNGVKLHHATYRDLKASCPGLVSDLLIQARVKATETLKSAFTWQAKKQAAYPKKVARAKKQGRAIPLVSDLRV
jgi:putative transposase